MTATTRFLLILLCSTASVALVAQDGKDDASKDKEKTTSEQKQTPQPGQIPGLFGMPGQGQNPWLFGGQPGGSQDRNNSQDKNKDGKQNDDSRNTFPWGQAPAPGFGGGQPGGLFGSGNPWETRGSFGGLGGFGGSPRPFNPWDDSPMFFGGSGQLFGMGNPREENSNPFGGSGNSGGSGRRGGGLFGSGNPWIDNPFSSMEFGFGGAPGSGMGGFGGPGSGMGGFGGLGGFGGPGGFGGAPGGAGMGGFGGPGMGGFGGGPGMGDNSRRNMSMIDTIPAEDRERLLKLMQTDYDAFRKELRELVSGKQENEYKAAMELREKYLKATSNAEKDKIKAELRELIGVRFQTYNKSAERQIAETEETIASAQERLSTLKKLYEERVKNADIFIDSTIADYLNPDKEPTYEDALRKQNEQSARSRLPELDNNRQGSRGGRGGNGSSRDDQRRGGQGGGNFGGFGGMGGAPGMGGFGSPGFGGPPSIPQQQSNK